MKTIFTYALLGTLLAANSGCEKGQKNPTVASEACAPTVQPVKSVTDVEGTIGFDPQLGQYFIRRTIPGTFDSVDFGFLCGTVPPSLTAVGSTVVFSGAYKPYDKQPPAGPAGQKFYYLEISKAVARTTNE